MVIATAVALIQFAHVRVLTQIARFYIWVIRGTPLLVQLFVVFYGLPDVGIMLDPFPAAVIVFAINEGAYCAETMRAALEAVPVGTDRGGLLRGHELFADHAAHRAAAGAAHGVPAAVQFADCVMVKDTSLASNITVMEMFMATQRIAARTYEMLPLYCEVAVIYLLFSTVLTFLQRGGRKEAVRLRQTKGGDDPCSHIQHVQEAFRRYRGAARRKSARGQGRRGRDPRPQRLRARRRCSAA